MGRRRWVAIGVMILAAVTASPTTAGAPAPTRVEGFSPIDDAGHLHRGLRITRTLHGTCIQGPSSEAIGDLGFRCAGGDPCWLDGPAPTHDLICVGTPWTRRATRMTDAELMIRTGVAYGRPSHAGEPWGIELTDGHRCTLRQGAHDKLPAALGGTVVDYSCTPGNLSLLRDLHKRGGRWTIGAARLHHPRWARLGRRHIRRAIYGTLAAPERRQAVVARAAIRASGIRHPLRVQLAFPGLRWASVIGLEGVRVVRRTTGPWHRVHIARPHCSSPRVPRTVRHQIFGCRG